MMVKSLGCILSISNAACLQKTNDRDFVDISFRHSKFGIPDSNLGKHRFPLKTSIRELHSCIQAFGQIQGTGFLRQLRRFFFLAYETWEIRTYQTIQKKEMLLFTHTYIHILYIHGQKRSKNIFCGGGTVYSRGRLESRDDQAYNLRIGSGAKVRKQLSAQPT